MIFHPVSRRVHALCTRLLVALFLSSFFSITVVAQEPTLQDALEATAGDLAQGYLWTKIMLDFLPVTDTGMTIQLPDEAITESNADEYRAGYEKRLSLYRQAIEQRGYQNISGIYQSKTTRSCAKIKSLWVSAIHETSDSIIEIKQDDMSADFVIKGTSNNQEFSLDNPAAIAESSIAILDAMNSEYYFRGEVQDQGIVIKPTLSVLNTWPSWAGPPSRRDLKNCEITLKPITQD